MKKSILAVAGVAALAGVVAPVAGVFAENPQDTIAVIIGDSCTLGYKSDSAHTAGTAATGAGSWSGNTLSKTIANNDADTNIGSTNFTVTCNYNIGYNVALTATALTGTTTPAGGSDKNSIPYITSASAPSAGTSTWGVKSGDNWILTTGTVKSESSAVASSEWSVVYGVATSTTQPADTYTGTATYTISKKTS